IHAVHRSYDSSLQTIELSVLIPTLKTMLAAMQSDLATGTGAALPAEVRADVDLFVTVARRLLGEATVSPVAGADVTAIADLVTAAMRASGIPAVPLFGETRYVDFSQFTPRGHYASDTRLQTYFRAMIWLGRTDLRFLQYDTSASPDAPPHFFRRQFLAALLLAELTDASAQIERWRQIDDGLRAYVGGPETVP